MKEISVKFSEKAKTLFEKLHPVEVHGIAPHGPVQLDLSEAFTLYRAIKECCKFDMIDEFFSKMEREKKTT